MGGIGFDVKALIKLGQLALVLMLLSACVRPAEPTPIPTEAPPIEPTSVASPTPALPTATPSANPTFPVVNVSAWILGNLRINSVNSMDLFTQFSIETDEIVGYTFFNEFGQFCIGFVLVTSSPPTVWNGDYRCLDAGETASAYQSLPFTLTNGTLYSAVYGYLDPNTYSNVGAAVVTFTNRASFSHFLGSASGYVILYPALEQGTELIVTNNTNGDFLVRVPIQP